MSEQTSEIARLTNAERKAIRERVLANWPLEPDDDTDAEVGDVADGVAIEVEFILGERLAPASALIGLSQDIRTISRTISGSYPADLDPEAHLWRRCMKVTEEAGEVFEALAGMLGENPRKGQTHTRDDVRAELLDVAGAALGAVSHLDGDEGEPVVWLAGRLSFVRQRIVAATRKPPGLHEGQRR